MREPHPGPSAVIPPHPFAASSHGLNGRCAARAQMAAWSWGCGMAGSVGGNPHAVNYEQSGEPV